MHIYGNSDSFQLPIGGEQRNEQGMNSASLRSLAGRYDNPIPHRFLAPIDFLKIPALSTLAPRSADMNSCKFLARLYGRCLPKIIPLKEDSVKKISQKNVLKKY